MNSGQTIVGGASRDAVGRFWDKFIDRARKNGVKETATRWQVRHAETYLKAFPDKRLGQHTRDDVHGYLKQAGELDRMADWRLAQIVDAIQNLLVTARAPVAEEVDWGFWRDSARTLGPDHPTIAREAAPVHTGPSNDAPVSGERFKEKRNAPSVFDAARDTHRALLERMTAEIRRRKYSIRTEQAYESWVCRFILFCGNRDPAVVGDGKGQKDRVVPLPERLEERLQAQLAEVRAVHEQDLAQGYGEVFLPDALARKWPNAPKEWIWQYLFPSGRLSVDPRSGKTRRHHVHENGLQKAVKAAAQRAGLTKKVNCHCLRHSFATPLLESGYDIRIVQELLGHADVSTTMIYTRVLNRGGKGVRSPLDGLL